MQDGLFALPEVLRRRISSSPCETAETYSPIGRPLATYRLTLCKRKKTAEVH